MLSLVLVFLALVLSGVTGVMACRAPTDKNALENLNDASIAADVKGKLMAENMLNFARVDVGIEGGTVLLNGVVPTSELKVRAEQLAGQTNGVKRVTNNLQVRTIRQK
jgi:osmotically-inducible protein OsmY